MSIKTEAARIAISRGGVIPMDYALQMSQEGIFLQEFEDSIDGFSVEKFIDEYEFYDNV